MIITYEIRTARGAPVFAYDCEIRARQEMARSEKRVGIQMKLYKITRTEELCQ